MIVFDDSTFNAHADLNVRDKSGRTAIQLAEAALSKAREGYKKTIELLRNAGAQK